MTATLDRLILRLACCPRGGDAHGGGGGGGARRQGGAYDVTSAANKAGIGHVMAHMGGNAVLVRWAL